MKDSGAHCDAMILASPITDIRSDFPPWIISAVNITGFLFPKARISLESLSGEDEVRVTKTQSTKSRLLPIHTISANTLCDS
jgi:hypothetical protein